jgi:uncharacterized protein
MSQPDDPPPELVPVPWSELAPGTLDALIESFVLREGTDYGVQETPLATKVVQVRQQLERGEAQIVFDPATESVDIRVVVGRRLRDL